MLSSSANGNKMPHTFGGVRRSTGLPESGLAAVIPPIGQDDR
jgi:hypothetical protein